ncbi:MAG: transposase [Gemmataceae bacterium]
MTEFKRSRTSGAIVEESMRRAILSLHMPRAGQGAGGVGSAEKGAEASELVLLSQDEVRFSMVSKLGGKGHRPSVGTWDNKGLLYVFAVVNVVSAAVHANTRQSPKDAARRNGLNKTWRLKRTFATHLQHVGRHYPATRHRRVVLIIDNAPWHAGGPVRGALAESSHLELYRLPGYSPCLNVVERFWRLIRRRATHHRLFDTLGDRKRSIRNYLCYFQTLRLRAMSLMKGW